jgi:hypothetical protein
MIPAVAEVLPSSRRALPAGRIAYGVPALVSGASTGQSASVCR